MADVPLTIFANPQEAEKALVRLEKRVQALTAKARAGSRSQKKGVDAAGASYRNMGAAISRVGLQIVGITGGMAAFLKTVQLAGNEINKINLRRSLAGDLSVELAPLQITAVQNLGREDPLKATEMLKRLDEIAASTAVPRTTVTAAAAEVLSARGALPAEKALDALEAALKIQRFDPEASLALSGGAVALGQTTGATPEQALGFLSAAATESRVTSPKDVGENLGPAVATSIAFGGSAREAAALFASLSQAVQDPQGAESFTGSIAFQRSLESALAPRETGLTSTLERIRHLQEHPEQAELFMEGKLVEGQTATFGKGKAIPFFRALVGDPRSDPKFRESVQNRFNESLRKLPDLGPASATVFETELADIEKLQSVRDARLRQQMASAKTRILLDDPEVARAGIAQQGVSDILQALPISDIEKRLLETEFQARTLGGGQAAVPAAIEILSRQSAALRSTEIRPPTFAEMAEKGFGPGFGTPIEAVPTTAELRRADILDAAIKELQRQQQTEVPVAVRPADLPAPGLQNRADLSTLLDQSQLPEPQQADLETRVARRSRATGKEELPAAVEIVRERIQELKPTDSGENIQALQDLMGQLIDLQKRSIELQEQSNTTQEQTKQAVKSRSINRNSSNDEPR